MAKKSKFSRMTALLPKTGLFIILVLASQLFKEFYPLSNYPMYAKISDRNWYFYVTDEMNRHVPMERAFGMSSSQLRRLYRRNLGKTHQRNVPIATQMTLEELFKNLKDPALATQLTLHQVDFRIEDHHIVRKERSLGNLQR